MTKKHYKKADTKYWSDRLCDWRDWPYAKDRYEFTFTSHYRYVRTMNERRQNQSAMDDGYNVRGKRRPHMLRTVWCDVRVSKCWKKSWKDFTKADKQYNKNT
jgi:hypothetical protein